MFLSEQLPIDILVLSDDKTTLEMLQNTFTQYVNNIIIAQNIQDAIKICQSSHNINIALIDMDMLDGDGISITQELIDSDSAISLIAMTSNSAIATVLEDLKVGFSSIIKKPLDFGELYSLLFNTYELGCAIKDKIDANHFLQEYHKVIDSGFMVSKTNVDGIITFANDAFCKISGYSKEELIGSSHNMIRHPKMDRAVFSSMWQTIKAKKIWRGKVMNKRKDGSVYYVDSVISPILDSNGNIVEFLAIRQDITKLIEAHQKVLKEQNEKALAAKAHYEELTKSKLTLLNLFSHELKTPLNAVINFSKIIQRRLDNIDNLSDKNDMAELMHHIVENAEQMGTMISDIVNVMKLQAGAAVINSKHIALPDIIDETLLHYECGDKIEIVKEFCPNPSLLTLDPIYAKKIIGNIYANSLKYARSLVVLSYQEIKDEFVLTIQDDGDGFVNPNMAIELFEQNEDNFLTRQSHGIGIGLYHAKLCAQTLGWTLQIANRCDKLCGACVKISGNIK